MSNEQGNLNNMKSKFFECEYEGALYIWEVYNLNASCSSYRNKWTYGLMYNPATKYLETHKEIEQN